MPRGKAEAAVMEQPAMTEEQSMDGAVLPTEIADAPTLQDGAPIASQAYTPTMPTTPNLRSIVDIIADLKKPINARFLKERVGAGNMRLTYYEWHTAVKYLDHFAPGWCFSVQQLISTEGHVGVVGRLTIPSLEGLIYREDIGGDYEHQDEARRSKGFDPFLDAKQQAFKRCCAQFGFGLYLYDKS